MRTLKKALSLVLVLAMVFTLAVPALAVDKASEFKDYAKVQNKEAVDVLTAIGVINGNPDGTFGAEGKFTRAQAATMIAYLTLGKTVADALPTAGTEFSDVPASFWGAKYIQYCADEGIINGYGNGKFGPDDTLTATQWALMLLGALGYQAKNEGIGGAGWEIATTKLAMKAGVASADELTGTFNRDLAAKMALNTLKADVVEYSTNGTSIIVGGTTIQTGASKAEKVMTKDENGGNMGDAKNDDDEYVLQFAEQHFPKLKVSTSSKTDDLGRPATVWTLDKESNVIATGAAKATLVYTTSLKIDNVKKDLKGYTKADNMTFTRTDPTYTAPLTSKLDTIDKIADQLVKDSGNGKVIEIYTNNKNEITHIVEIAADFAPVTVKEVKETKTVGAHTVYTVGGKSYNVFSTVVNEDKDVDKAVVSGEVANKDYVLYYVDGDGVAHISAVETITGTVTAATNAGVYTIDGEKYEKAEAYVKIDGTDITVSKKAGEYYVDANGYILGVKKADNTTNYGFVISTEKFSTLKDNKVVENYTATVALSDGSVEVLSIDKESYDKYAKLDGTAKAAESFTTSPAVTYADTDTDGEYTLDTIDSGDKYAKVTEIVAEKLELSGVSGNLKYVNSNTKFVVANYETNAKNERVATGTVTVYTGAANVPSFSEEAYAIDVDANADQIADVVFILKDTAAAVSSDYVYVVGTYTDTVNGREWDVIINGEAKTVTTSKDVTVDTDTTVDADHLIADKLYSKIVLDGGKVNATDTKLLESKYTSVIYIGGLLKFNDSAVKSCAADVAVYTVDHTDKTIAVSTADSLTETVEGNIALATAADGTVTGIYVF